MKLRVKSALLGLCTGAVALNTGACLFRFLGDWVGDHFWMSLIN